MTEVATTQTEKASQKAKKSPNWAAQAALVEGLKGQTKDTDELVKYHPFDSDMDGLITLRALSHSFHHSYRYYQPYSNEGTSRSFSTTANSSGCCVPPLEFLGGFPPLVGRW